MTADTDTPTETGIEQERSAVTRARTLLDRYRIPVGLVLLVVFLRPVVAHPWLLGFEQIATTMLIWMLFVAAFNLLFGYTGLLSFGHAMFFGFGVYGVAIGLSRFDLPFVLGAVIGIAVAASVGYVIGRLIVRKGEIYFAMLTLAFAQAIYFIVNKDPYGLTGGSNGISKNTLPAWVETYRGEKSIVLGAVQIDWYWLVGLVFLLAMVLLWQLVRSPFGRTLIAIRENQRLARAMGVDVERYKIAAFTFSAAFAAVAGVLLEINNQGASLETFGVFTSGDAVLMAVLGGVNYFFGPIAGTFVWLFTEDYLTDFTTLYLPLTELPLVSIELAGVLNFWRFFLGLLFVIVVLLSPKEGIWGFVTDLADRWTDDGDETEVIE
ncbi:MAG: branched-chain amino acid ABC transporter permease [Halobacteriales archaeon]|nr:branched-chain amino acid ABC transporter permease [Halobacteriales archaeon]